MLVIIKTTSHSFIKQFLLLIIIYICLILARQLLIVWIGVLTVNRIKIGLNVYQFMWFYKDMTGQGLKNGARRDTRTGRAR